MYIILDSKTGFPKHDNYNSSGNISGGQVINDIKQVLSDSMQESRGN